MCVSEVSEVSEEEDGRGGGGGGYRTKNKNPTRQCGEQSVDQYVRFVLYLQGPELSNFKAFFLLGGRLGRLWHPVFLH